MTDPVVHFAALLFIIMVVSSFVDRVGIENIVNGIVLVALAIGAIFIVFTSPGGAIALGSVIVFLWLCNSETVDRYLKSRHKPDTKPVPAWHILTAFGSIVLILGVGGWLTKVH
jgi:hypothetical protein